MSDEAKNPELEQLTKELEALRAKNRELLDEKKATKSGAERQLADAMDKIDELTAALDSSKRETDKAVKKLSAERDEALTLAQSEQKATAKLLIENGLTEELVKAGVPKERLKAARLLIESEGILNIETEGDMRKAVAKIMKDGKESKMSIAEFVSKEWIGRDEAKALIPDGNSGAGASGSSFVPGAKQMKLEAFAALKSTDQAAYMKEGGQLIE